MNNEKLSPFAMELVDRMKNSMTDEESAEQIFHAIEALCTSHLISTREGFILGSIFGMKKLSIDFENHIQEEDN